MFTFLLACAPKVEDDSATTSHPTVTEEGLPTALATVEPSCTEVDGGAWALIVGQATTTCPGASWAELDDVVYVNLGGAQEGPQEVGETIDLLAIPNYSAAGWVRNGFDGALSSAILVIDPWEQDAGTLTGSLDLTATFPDGEVHATGTFYAVYCPDPKMYCG
jgi:hypothetical protein